MGDKTIRQNWRENTRRINSAEADTQGFVFSPANLQRQTAITESRRALQFLYDPKNKPGLEGIMADLLGE
jgi:hypothetical protein